MNCNTFKKRLNDYLEGSISYDLKNSMDKHIEECKDCRKLYEQEKALDNMFEKTLSIENMNFTSSRGEIIRSIDRNKYGKSLFKKLILNLKRYKIAYSSCAALAVFMVLFIPMAIQKYNLMTEPKDDIVKIEEKVSEDTKVVDKKEEVVKEPEKPVEKKEVKTYSYLPEFSKTQVESLENEHFNSQWKDSPSNKLSAAVGGKGSEVQEEGIGDILVKETDGNNIFKFTLINNDKKRYTPKYIEWWDDSHLLVVVGYGFGTIDKGGNLYVIDVNSGKTYGAYETGDNKRQIVKVKKADNNLTLDILVYEDDNYLKSHRESLDIKDFKIESN